MSNWRPKSGKLKLRVDKGRREKIDQMKRNLWTAQVLLTESWFSEEEGDADFGKGVLVSIIKA